MATLNNYLAEVHGLDAGAAAYLTKPPDRADLLLAVRGAVAQGRVEVDARFAEIDPDLCSGCRMCNELCPYTAIGYDPDEGHVAVPNSQYQHQDAGGYYAAEGDTWSSAEFECDQNVFDMTCGVDDALLNDGRLWSARSPRRRSSSSA